MDRRSFFRLLAISPIAAPIAISNRPSAMVTVSLTLQMSEVETEEVLGRIAEQAASRAMQRAVAIANAKASARQMGA